MEHERRAAHDIRREKARKRGASYFISHRIRGNTYNVEQLAVLIGLLLFNRELEGAGGHPPTAMNAALQFRLLSLSLDIFLLLSLAPIMNGKRGFHQEKRTRRFWSWVFMALQPLLSLKMMMIWEDAESQWKQKQLSALRPCIFPVYKWPDGNTDNNGSLYKDT